MGSSTLDSHPVSPCISDSAPPSGSEGWGLRRRNSPKALVPRIASNVQVVLLLSQDTRTISGFLDMPLLLVPGLWCPASLDSLLPDHLKVLAEHKAKFDSAKNYCSASCIR